MKPKTDHASGGCWPSVAQPRAHGAAPAILAICGMAPLLAVAVAGCAGPQSTYDPLGENKSIDAAAWLDRGGAEESRGQHLEAIKCYDRALRIDPQLALAWSEKGVALGRLGRLDEARQCLDRALEINAGNAMTWVNKGVIARKQGRIEEEVECCERALKIDRRLGVAWYNKGAAFYQLKKCAEARSAFEEAKACGIADARRALAVLDKEKASSSDRVERAPSEYSGMMPPGFVAEADVTSRVKRWQQDCDQGKHAYTAPQQQRYAITGQGQPRYTITGQDVPSVFMLRRTNNAFIAAADIAGADGEPSTKGGLMQLRTLSITGEPVTSTNLWGVVWTPRASAIGRLDLAEPGKITASSDFNFDAFRDSPAVIPFANGYAINLFGQKLDEGGLLDTNAHPKGSYVTNDGKPLYGRVIRNRLGKLEETVLAP